MQADTTHGISVDPGEIPSMLATFFSYEAWLGPYHPQTLCLLTRIGIAYSEAGNAGRALPFLERAVRDLGDHLRPEHELRLQALAALGDLLVSTGDSDRAVTAHEELLRCQILSMGRDHPQTIATRESLTALLLQKTTGCAVREV